MSDFNFGENLRKIRLIKGISQDAMASLLNIPQTRYSRMENQSAVPDADMVNKLAEILKVPSADLLDPSGELEIQATPAAKAAFLAFASKLRKIVNRYFNKILLFFFAYVIVNFFYTAAKGGASGFGASYKTMMIVGLSVALFFSILIYLLFRKDKIR